MYNAFVQTKNILFTLLEECLFITLKEPRKNILRNSKNISWQLHNN